MSDSVKNALTRLSKYSTMPSMSTRMSHRVVRRPNVPLTARDETDLALLRASPAFRRALERLCPNGPSADADVGEAMLLHAVLEAGLAAIRMSAEEEGYEQLAVDYAEDAGARRRMSRRRLPAWTDEP